VRTHAVQYHDEHLWTPQTGGARVDVRQYNRSLAGADYVCKCLGANAYELNKYSFANTVTLSASVIRLIAGIDASGDRRCGRDTWKNGLVAKVAGHNQVVPVVSSLYDETASVVAGMAAWFCIDVVNFTIVGQKTRRWKSARWCCR